jgi:hypothetical protein
MWRKALTHEDIKDNLRSPLGIAAEKRSKLRMKLKEKKKKKEGGGGSFFPAIEL